MAYFYLSGKLTSYHYDEGKLVIKSEGAHRRGTRLLCAVRLIYVCYAIVRVLGLLQSQVSHRTFASAVVYHYWFHRPAVWYYVLSMLHDVAVHHTAICTERGI